jgi:hypothetical protein
MAALLIFLDRPVHPFDLTIRPRVPWFGQPVFDVQVGASRFEGMAAEGEVLRPHLSDVLGRPAIAGRVGEVRAILGEHRVDLVGYRPGEVTQEVAGYSPSGLLVQLDEGELGGAIDGHQQVEAPFLGANLGNVDVERGGSDDDPGDHRPAEPKRVALELALVRRVALEPGQLRDAMALETAVQ